MNDYDYNTEGNVLKAPGQFGPAEAGVNADNELTAWTQVANQLTVAGQVEPGPKSNKWYDSTAQARGQSAWVGTSDGAFSILGVPVTPGVNVLTATVTDVSGNVATQFVSFTVAATNQWGFTYDSNGNMAGATNQTSAFSYGYDAENRLTTVISNGVAVLQCWYDGTGHRIAKREIIGTQTNAVQYVWDAWTLVAVLGSDGQLKEHYTRRAGIAGDIGTLVAATHYTNGSAIATYYLHNNHRGDVILARQGTNTVATLDYTPYGESRSYSGSYTPRFRFSSKEYDASTGFYHFPYRYYVPQWARWLSRDSIEERGGLNLYGYVKDNPIIYIDPNGKGFIGLIGGFLTGEAVCAAAYGAMVLIEDYGEWQHAHCMASCKIKKGCLGGKGTAIAAGFAKEVYDLISCLTQAYLTGSTFSGACYSAFQPSDFENNKKGYSCPPKKSCEDQCKDLEGAGENPVPGPIFGSTIAW